MNSNVMVALLSFVSSSIGAFVGIILNNNLMKYRLEQLEKKVDKHNNLIDRMYKVESKQDLYAEDMKVANHRIEDLEKKAV